MNTMPISVVRDVSPWPMSDMKKEALCCIWLFNNTERYLMYSFIASASLHAHAPHALFQTKLARYNKEYKPE